MSQKTILIEDAQYLYINEAAKTAGLGPDYIARLCRRGAIKGTKIDRVWYVSEQSLKNFLVAHTYQKAIWREHVARVRRKEYQRALLLAEPSAHRRNAITTIAPPELLSPRIIARVEQRLASEAHGAAQLVGGGATYAISPAFQLLHKVAALVTTVLVVVGTYSLVNPNVRTSTLASLPQTASAALAFGAKLESSFNDVKDDLFALLFGKPTHVKVIVEPQPRP